MNRPAIRSLATSLLWVKEQFGEGVRVGRPLVLLAVAYHDGVTETEIAEWTGMQPANVSQALDLLGTGRDRYGRQSTGLIMRPHGTRPKVITLTAKGRKFVERMVAI